MKDYLILDLETTALPHEDGSIAEIAILEVRDHKIVDRLHFLVNPSTPMTAAAALANGIKPAALEHCPKFTEIEPEITAWLDTDLPILGYNCDKFDKEIVRMEYARLGRKPPNSTWIDVYKIVCKKYTLFEIHEKTGVKSRTQTNMASFFGVSAIGAHRAMADVIILHSIFKRIVAENRPDKEETVRSENKNEIVKSEKKDNGIIEKLSKLDAQKIIASALANANALSKKFSAQIAKYSSLRINSKFTFEESTFAISWLESSKKEITKSRIESLYQIKSTVSLVEDLYRTVLLTPTSDALDRIIEERKSFVKKAFEDERAAAEKKKEEIEKNSRNNRSESI